MSPGRFQQCIGTQLRITIGGRHHEQGVHRLSILLLFQPAQADLQLGLGAQLRGGSVLHLGVEVDGLVELLLLLEGVEVEIKLPGRFKISPQIAGALKAAPGVVAVDAM